MGKKMLNTTVLKSTDSQRVGIKEILSIESGDGSKGPRRPPISPHPGPTTGEGGDEGNGGTPNPKQPRMTLVKLAEMFVEQNKQINSRFDRLEARMTKVEDTLQTVINLNNLKTE